MIREQIADHISASIEGQNPGIHNWLSRKISERLRPDTTKLKEIITGCIKEFESIQHQLTEYLQNGLISQEKDTSNLYPALRIDLQMTIKEMQEIIAKYTEVKIGQFNSQKLSLAYDELKSSFHEYNSILCIIADICEPEKSLESYKKSGVISQ